MTAHDQSTVHMIFKTHLDVGFTDYAHRVVERYFRHFIPGAIALAKTMRESNNDAGFVWTTGSWLIYEYLEQANPDERRLMEEAIIAGDITWHGLPFTTHTELLDVSLCRYGLKLAKRLDERFGKKTIAAKMTDVPGHTRGLVPLLAEAGITFLHIGVNPASAVPDVPPVFVWQDEPSDTEIVVMYHHVYGNTTTIPGLRDAVSIILTGDNIGPQSPEDVEAAFKLMRSRFAGANVIASTLDAFAAKLPQIKHELPVLTDEIGDTWIHGMGTDPVKVARFRELSRLRNHWIRVGHIEEDAPDFARFSHNLLLVAEHTWGLDEKTHLPIHEHYNRKEFYAARESQAFQRFEASWGEQRNYLEHAIKSLEKPSLSEEASTRLEVLAPSRFTLDDSEASWSPGEIYESEHFRLRFDEFGALVDLTNHKSNYAWASERKPLGMLIYQTFTHEDYERFWREYIRNRDDPTVTFWAREDYTKPGLEYARSVSRDWKPALHGLEHRSDQDGDSFLLQMKMPEPAYCEYGCPQEFQLVVFLPSEQAEVHFDLRWFDKPASRMPEALWFSFNPIVENPEGWWMEKLGQRISPLEVVSRGGRNLHAVGRGVMHTGSSQSLYIDTLDAPLVAPGRRALLSFDDAQPPLENGMHFNLYNNVWGTNFPMWFDEDARFRFVLHTDRTGSSLIGK